MCDYGYVCVMCMHIVVHTWYMDVKARRFSSGLLHLMSLRQGLSLNL